MLTIQKLQIKILKRLILYFISIGAIACSSIKDINESNDQELDTNLEASEYMFHYSAGVDEDVGIHKHRNVNKHKTDPEIKDSNKLEVDEEEDLVSDSINKDSENTDPKEKKKLEYETENKRKQKNNNKKEKIEIEVIEEDKEKEYEKLEDKLEDKLEEKLEEKEDEKLEEELKEKQQEKLVNEVKQKQTINDEKTDVNIRDKEIFDIESMKDVEEIEKKIEETKEEARALKEIKSIVKFRNGLNNGTWFKKNEQMAAGISCAKFHGILSGDFETIMNRYLDINNTIDIIESFESVFKYKYKLHADKKITDEEFSKSLGDFGLYSASMILLKAMLETKGEDGTLRYVSDEEKYNKKFISKRSADILLKKVNRFIHTAEILSEENELQNNKTSKLATILNIIESKAFLEELDSLIGTASLDYTEECSRIDPETFDFDRRIEYKKNLRPGSILWTWLNSKSLCKHSLQNILGMTSEGDNIVHTFNNLLNLKDEYIRFIEKLESIKNNNSISYTEKSSIIEKYIIKLKENEQFIEINEKGKKALSDLREIMNKTKMYQIAGRKSKTLGKEFVGNWVGSDDRKRISVEQAEQLESELDLLSTMQVFVESEGKLHCDINHSKSSRAYEKLWCFESEKEQLQRETENRAMKTKLLAQGLVVITLITGMIPFVGPAANIALFAIKIGIVGGILGV